MMLMSLREHKNDKFLEESSMNWKRPLAVSLAALTLGGTLAACSNPTAGTPTPSAQPVVESPVVNADAVKAPKYVFMFIGDGMR